MQFYRRIVSDYERMQFGYEVLKQVGRASELLGESEWHDILVNALESINDDDISLTLTQVWFYLQMAIMLGYELNTQYDYEGDKLLANQVYRYDETEKDALLYRIRGLDHC